MKYSTLLSAGLASSAAAKPLNVASPRQAGSNQQIAIASYIPTWDSAAWNALISNFTSNQLSVLVANVVNGPDYAVVPEWKDIIDRGHGAGKTVLGYVRTGFLGYPLNAITPKTTREGSSRVEDWIEQIERDVDTWYDLYKDSIGGIFFDEGYNICDNVYAGEIYAYLDRYTKLKHPGAFTVVNPGAPMGECFKHSMDTLLTYEQNYVNYTKDNWQGNNWVPDDIRKIWHIVYETPEDKIEEVAAKALERGAGLLQITNDAYPNPYDQLPSESYMRKQVAAVDGGRPLVEKKSWEDGPAASTPGGLTVGDVDYGAVRLSWSAAQNAKGYQIYQNGVVTASVTVNMTSVLVAGLQPATTYSFAVAAIGGKGVESGKSATVQATTKTLPADGKGLTNLAVEVRGNQIVLSADVLLAYAKFKVFLWDKSGCDFHVEPAWPVKYDVEGHWVCARYLFEGDTFYYYSGVPTSEDPGYTWSAIKTYEFDELPVVNGKKRTWTFPLDGHYPQATNLAVEASAYYPTVVEVEPQPSV